MWVTSLLCIIYCVTVANGANILGIFMTPSYSHQIVYQPIWKELSLKGHRVTVYTPSPLNDSTLTNLTEYDLGFSKKHLIGMENAAYDINKWLDIYGNVFESQMNHLYMQDLLKNANNETYDLLLVEYLWQPYYAFKDIYNVPMVGITSLPLTIGGSDTLGIERHPVVDPDLFLKFSQAINFKERFVSWVYNWIYRLVMKIKMAPLFNSYLKKYFKTVTKNTFELAKEVTLVIGNYNFALHNIKALTPNFIPISGIHIQPEKPLPADLAKLLDNLKHDAIYFSLGTTVKASTVSEDKLTKIFNVLGKLPYTILWKYESDNLPNNLPNNFITRKWFPQQDVLGHPRVKLFITQGGLQSLDESISRRVPILAIPFLVDQNANSDKCVRLGIAESINFYSYTEEELDDKIRKLLSDPSYQENVDKQANILSDQPMNPLDSAVYWIEYVLRHNGAQHLRYSVVDLPFYQYYLLDVYLFVGLLCTLLVYISRKIIIILVSSMRVLHRLVFKTKEKTK